MKYFILLLCFVGTLSANKYREIYKYETNYMYSIGLSTQSFLFDHPAINTMFFDNIEDYIEGGSFDGAQSGLDLRVTYILPQNEKIHLTGGLDYTFLSSKEQYTISNSSVTNYKHKINLISPYVGAYYRIFRIPLANTNIYFGPELKFNMIRNGEFQYEIQNILDKNKTLIIDDYIKDDAFRVGGLLRLGAEGGLNKEIGINVSVALHWVNMIGSDDSYGELFTIAGNEASEVNLFLFNFNISLFYRK